MAQLSDLLRLHPILLWKGGLRFGSPCISARRFCVELQCVSLSGTNGFNTLHRRYDKRFVAQSSHPHTGLDFGPMASCPSGMGLWSFRRLYNFAKFIPLAVHACRNRVPPPSSLSPIIRNMALVWQLSSSSITLYSSSVISTASLSKCVSVDRV